MISKEQFLTIKRLKQDGVPITVISRRMGISEPTTRKWVRMDEAGFDALRRNDIPYIRHSRKVHYSSLKAETKSRMTCSAISS